MRFVRFACLLSLVGALPGCNNSRDNTNPFANAAQTVPPPASAAIVYTSSLWSLVPGDTREVYAVNADGSGVTRLTFCNNPDQLIQCDSAEASPAPDRVRMALRRASVDSNGDGQVTEADGTALVFDDLQRGVEALLVPASRIVTGVDWGPSGSFIVYSGLPAGGGVQDLFRIDYNGQNDTDLTCPANTTGCNFTIKETRPRIDSSESIAVFQYTDSTSGHSQVALFQTSANQPLLTTGPSDADPAFSPDATHVVFRRLTDAAANGGRGSWNIVTIASDGTGLAVVISGPAYRGAPDWGPSGLTWAESDATGVRLMASAADGSNVRVLVTQAVGTQLTNPRWLPPSQ
jgi:Tol biopolymer transport system component